MSDAARYPFRHEFDRSRYALSWLQLCVPESNVEETILHSLKVRGIQAEKIDAGGRAMRGKLLQVLRRFGIAAPTANKIAAMVFGSAPTGWLDITGVLPGGRALFIEVKAPEWLERSEKTGRLIQKRKAGTPEPEQLDFMVRMHRQGALVGICWSPDDLGDLLRRA
jgi:hypothetical protein